MKKNKGFNSLLEIDRNSSSYVLAHRSVGYRRCCDALQSNDDTSILQID